MVICAILGTAIIFIVAKYLFRIVTKITIFKDIIYWYSVNSLAVFPVHLTVKVLSIPLLALIGLNTWIFLFATMLIITIPIVNIISYYVPFMVGENKRRSS